MDHIDQRKAVSTPEDYLKGLKGVEWFSSVGSLVTSPIGTTPLSSWDEAFRWTENPVSWWCNVEGAKQLYETLAKTHYERFVSWNDIARSLLPQVKELLENHVFPCVPSGVQLPQKAQVWIQSQILSATMELAFDDCVLVRLFQDQVELYRRGHFPCGWNVAGPEDFPQRATVIVF